MTGRMPDSSLDLHFVAAVGHIRLLETWGRLHPDLLATYDSRGDLPLHIAARRGRADAVKVLVAELRQDPGTPNAAGQTALELAAASGRLSVVRYLSSLPGVPLEKAVKAAIAYPEPEIRHEMLSLLQTPARL